MAAKPAGLRRREVLRLGLLGGLGLAGIGAVGGLVALAWPRENGNFGGTIDAGLIDEIQRGEVKSYREGKFYLARYAEPALGNREVLTALYWKCAHLGCTVAWKPDESYEEEHGVFLCPCHGSIYTRSGQNIGGPAPRPLDIMAIRLDGRRIFVETGVIAQRVQYDPKQATPL